MKSYRIDITEYEVSSDILTSFADGQTIHTWYDRQSRLWITQHKDSEGNQIGDADYSPNRKLANMTHKLFVEQMLI